ncbi:MULTISPECIES: hypothetical protein [unclassified Halomonas]|uniref:hypothetical protein n=1 Tax=unclassified Halomonas TaxID=2609666 RepID=UPI001EF726AD|nr:MULTISPECIES: hypothetical protein [unclassified Halomonas]MCG7589704.1 hypothetical protein [Halomonas sp. McD50-5]MCG7616247.1 hypothetical protein [Halomonas sp. McD50-4]
MLMLFRRMAAVIRLSRAGRGQDLDKVIDRMERGCHLEGALGEMLLILMPKRKNGWVEQCLRGGDKQLSDDELHRLGRDWAHRLLRHIKATRRDSSGGE